MRFGERIGNKCENYQILGESLKFVKVYRIFTKPTPSFISASIVLKLSLFINKTVYFLQNFTSKSHLSNRTIESWQPAHQCARPTNDNKEPLHTLETKRTPTQIKHTRTTRKRNINICILTV